MENGSGKKIIFSGIQATGSPVLGNYLGAIRNWALLSEEYDCLYCVVDLHSITVRQEPSVLRRRCLELMATLIACGIEPDKNCMFMQSHVPAHAELTWILNCFTYMGELSRMTQYKDKSKKHEDNINLGLFAYPALMAADILLYDAALVPVGSDQKQHLELTRDIAIRFNNIYGQTFTVPEPYIPKVGSRIMSLQDPLSKMSKSDPEDTFIALLDAPDVIRKKIRKAVTDLDNRVQYEEGRPGIANLMTIYSAITGASFDEVTAAFDGKGYGVFKDAVADVVIDALTPIKTRYDQVISDKPYLEGCINKGSENASKRAARMLSKVSRKIGLAPKKLT